MKNTLRVDFKEYIENKFRIFCKNPFEKNPFGENPFETNPFKKEPFYCRKFKIFN